MRISQLLIGANPGDAVTEAALRLQGAYSRIAESQVFAVHIHPELDGRVLKFEQFPLDGTPEDVLIVHVSIGEPGIVDFVANCPERVILSYHNITPASFFESFEPGFAARLRSGRWDLKNLAGTALGAIADSAFNACELEALGMVDVEVAPPPLHLDRLHLVEPDPDLTAHLKQVQDPIVLVVGQILPHKRADLAVDALHLLNVNHLPGARMYLAGRFTNPTWSSALIRHVESLKLDTVRVLGAVTDAQLGALYRRADVLLVPSEHEGFCVPLVEAFSFGVPAIGRAFGAIPETAGNAALVLPRDAGPAEMAEAMARVLSDRNVRTEMGRRGLERSVHFTADATLGASVAALARVLQRANAAGLP